MSTLPLTEPPRSIGSGIRLAVLRSHRAAAALAAALVLLILYAAFAHGAGGLAAGARVQAILAAIAALAGIGCLWTGTLHFTRSRAALGGFALLLGFAVWSGISLAWSVSADSTWVELNRDLTYLVLLALAIVVGASAQRAEELTATTFLAGTLLVTLYALGQKLLPGLRISGVFSLDHTGALPRLQEPLGYWNALCLFITLGVPTALALSVERGRSPQLRLAALVALQCMLLTIGFTFSRGGLIALAVALIVIVIASGARLRALMWLGVAGLGAAPGLAYGLTDGSLTQANVALGQRESAGAILLAVLVASVVLVAVIARWLRAQEMSRRVDEAAQRRLGAALGGVVLGAVIVALALVSLSGRGLAGTVSHAWHSFTATRATSNYSPDRLLSADSENRWVWWKEAAGAFSDRPLGGWGAGTFGTVHLLYRRDTLSVDQPHSVPMQFLSETGLVGALLGLGALVVLLVAAGRAVRARPAGRERLMAAALLAGAAAYVVHALYDWDWDIPAVTLPALLFLGVLAGASPASRRMRQIEVARRAGRLGQALRLSALTAALTTLAVSGALPPIAASEATGAVVTAAGSSAATIQQAQAQARIASGLDPLSGAGLRVEATIATRQGELEQARHDLLRAIARDPSDRAAWGQLVYVETALGNSSAALTAALRGLALDPEHPAALALAWTAAVRDTLERTPPSASATAQPAQ
jgi:hypothetical protein